MSQLVSDNEIRNTTVFSNKLLCILSDDITKLNDMIYCIFKCLVKQQTLLMDVLTQAVTILAIKILDLYQ